MVQESVDRQGKSNQNLPIEVIAVPQYDDTQLYNIQNNSTTPINIKIKIRNKEVGKKHGVISVPKLTAYSSEKKVHLVTSDQTIMSFDYFMEADTSKKEQKKFHKNIFHIFRPGGCLNIQNDNDDKYPYLPSSLNDGNKIKNIASNVDIQSKIISENIALKKNFPSTTPNDMASKTPRIFMGKCKPGGCLDPPFNEDKYSYKPTIKLSIASLKTNSPNHNNENDYLINQSNADSLKKESDLKIKLKENNKDIVQSQTSNTLLGENYSHSLITYPLFPSSSNLKIRKQSHDSKLKTRISNEDKARISVNEFSDIYFMPPKKERIKKLENNHPEQVSKTEVETENIDKNKIHSLRQQQLKSSEGALESHVLRASLNTNSINSNIDGSKLNVVKHKKISSDGKTHKGSLDSDQSRVENEFVEIVSNAEISALNLINIDNDKNIISTKNSKEIDLMDKTYLKESKELFTEKRDKIANIREDAINNTGESSILVQEGNGSKYFIKESKESFNKEYEEMADAKDMKLLSLENKEMQKSDENININYTDVPRKEIKEHFVKESKESFKKEPEDIADTDDIKRPSLKSKETQNTDERSTTNHTAVDADVEETKDIKQLFKTPNELFISEHEETVKKDVVRPLHSESKILQNINSNDSVNGGLIPSKDLKHSLDVNQISFREEPNIISSVSMTKKDKPSLCEKYLDDKNYEIVEPSSSTPTFPTLQDQENLFYEKALEPDNISQSDQMLRISKSIPNLNAIEKQQLNDISSRQIDNNVITNLSYDKVSIVNVNLKTENSKLNKPITEISPTDFIKQTSEIESSPTSLTRSKGDGVILNDRYEDRRVSTLGKFESLSSSVPLMKKNGADLTQKDIEAKSESDIIETIFVEKGSNEEIKDSKQSIIDKNFKPSELKPSDMNLKSSEILKVDEDKLHSIVDATNNDEVTKKMEVIDLKDLSKKSISTIQSKNIIITKSKTNILLEQSKEDRLHINANSLITIDFGFRYSVDNENRLVIHTFDPSEPINKNMKDKTCVIKSMIRVNDDKIRIPINFDTNLTLQIEKTGITYEGITLKNQDKSTNEFNKRSSVRTIDRDFLLLETLNTVYENLIPLNMIINNLKEEANMLSRQQTSFKEVLQTMEMKPMRLIHTERQCKCERKINSHANRTPNP